MYQEPSSQRSEAHGRTPRPLLLIVEDDEFVRDAVVYVLGGEQYDITEATSGEEALRLIEAQRFDALYTDIDLGGPVNGWQVATGFHERWPQAPIVCASARKQMKPSYAPAAVVFLIKPFDLNRLISAFDDDER